MKLNEDSGWQLSMKVWDVARIEKGVWKSRNPESGTGAGNGNGTGTGTGSGTQT